MDQESEVIKQQIEQTRSSLAEKLEALEEKVATTVTATTEAVSDTVENVKDAVEGTIDTVSESVEQVKEAFDLSKQVEAHPWLMVGGAVAVGYLGARLLETGVSQVSRELSTPPSPSQPASQGWHPANAGQPAAPAQPSLFDRLTESLVPTLAPAMDKLKELAFGATAGLVGRMVLESVPEALRGEVEQVINEFTRSLGGKPIPEFLHPKEEPMNPAQARASAPPPRS